MKIQISVTIGFAILLGTVISILAISSYTKKETNFLVQQEIPVNITQITLPNGEIPVKLECARVFLNHPDQLDTFSCKLKNHTNKNILSAVVTYSIFFETGTGQERTNQVLTVNSFIHPDLVKKLIEPNRAIEIKPPGPFSQPGGGTIQRLELKVDTVEFADNTILGVPGFGFEKIINMRQGALKYKNWLKQEFKVKGRNLQDISNLLADSTPIPGFVDISNRDQEIGANTYRNRMRKIIQKEGLGRLNSALNQ
jgi:hypothetical protein